MSFVSSCFAKGAKRPRDVNDALSLGALDGGRIGIGPDVDAAVGSDTDEKREEMN